MPRSAEAQCLWDWQFIPGIQSLSFVTKVNFAPSLSIERLLRRGGEKVAKEDSIGAAAAKIYKLLWDGEYQKPDGSRAQIKGDTTKIMHAIGLTNTQRALLQHFFFMTARIPGTREVRRMVNHKVFSGRIVYGLPLFLTATPSERHSGPMSRLSQYRRNDPAVCFGNPKSLPWAGHDKPSLEATEEADIELPDYDLRRLMLARDPLCAVDAFQVTFRVVIATLLSVRMCPDCPHCALSDTPCSDVCGSNAEPMGGGPCAALMH